MRQNNDKVQNNDVKWIYSGYGIAFDGAGSWNFGDDFLTNAVIFGVDNSSSSHAENLKNKFLVIVEGLTCGVNGSFGVSEKKFSINRSKENTIFCLSLHYNCHNSYLSVNGIKIFVLKANNKNIIHSSWRSSWKLLA